MKKLLFMILILLSTISCSAARNNTQADMINSCKVGKDVFIFVLLDAKGKPENVFPSSTPIKKNTKSKRKLRSVLNTKHEIKRNQSICWQAVMVDPKNPSKLKLAERDISIIWKPSAKKLKYESMPKFHVPYDSPLDLEYKYAIAVKPAAINGKIKYLDPIIVIRN